MRQYQIITPYGELDTSDFHPEIQYSFEDVSEYTAGLASYSGDTPLPGTETNKRFFRQYYDVTADTKFDANKKVEAEIYADSALVFSGYLKLESVAMADDQPTFIVSFHETTRDFSDAIRDTFIKDLGWTELNHVRSIAAITSSWTAPIGSGYVYPKEITGRYDDPAATFTWQWNPATYIKTIWDKTFEAAGFTYSSGFLESEYFRRLIMPYGKSAVEMTDEQIQLQTARLGVSSTLPAIQTGSTLPVDFHALNTGSSNWRYELGIELQDSSSLEFNDAAGQWSTDRFICGRSGFYDIDFHAPLAFNYENPIHASVQLDSGQLEFHWEMILRKQGTSAVLIADSGRDQSNPYGVQTFIPTGTKDRGTVYTDAEFGIDLAASSVWMDPGDEVIIAISVRQEPNTEWRPAGGGLINIFVDVKPMILRYIGTDFTYFSVKPSSNVLMSDAEILYSQLLPQMSCVDFVGDIKTMFNLVFKSDRTNPKNILVEPYDTWMQSRKTIHNWDEKLDHASYEIVPTAAEVAQTYLYTYQEDADYFNTRYQEATGKIYGEQRFTTTNDINTDTEEVSIGFAATPVASAFDATQFIQPWYVNIQTSTDASEQSQVEAASVKPRILFYGGLLDTTQYSIQTSAANTPTPLTSYPYAGHWDHPTDPQWDLNWGLVESVNWTTTAAPAKTLFNQFHRNSLLNRVDPDARILRGAFALTAHDVADYDSRDRVYVAGAQWRVVSMRWIDASRLTDVVLMRELDNGEATRTTYSVPDTVASCPSDLVAKKDLRNNWYYYSSLSGQAVTRACCDSLGGNWNGGLCVIPNVSPPRPSMPGSTTTTAAAISTDRNQVIAQRGGVGKASGVSLKGAGNLASNRTSNVITYGSNNIYNNNNGIITLGSDNALNNVFQTIVLGDSNTVAEPTTNLPATSTRAFIAGDANTITPGTSYVNIFGSNITANTSSTTYIQNLKMSGNIEASSIIYGTASYALNSSGVTGRSYGSFYSTQTQTNVASTARSMSLNTTDITNGVSVSGSTSPFNTYIKVANAGVYNIQFSAQVDKTDSGTDEIWIWLRKNGTNISDSATSLQLVGNGSHYVAAWNFFVNAAANDYFQLMWYSSDANVRLHAETAFGVVPGIPSLIVTANRVD